MVMGLVRSGMQALQLFFSLILTLGYVLERGRGERDRERDRRTETDRQRDTDVKEIAIRCILRAP